MPARKKTSAPQKTVQKNRVYQKPLTEKHIIGFLFAIACCLSLFLGCLLLMLNLLKVPDIRSVAAYQPPQASEILDRHGHVLTRIYAINRTVVPIQELPPYLPQAFVAAEDSRFFSHPGLDFWSIFRAALNNTKSGRRGQGGSTITQQVAKSLLLSPEKTYSRKFKEAILAWRIDTLLSKTEILHIYLNQIYLGSGAYGVEAAAREYFAKSAKELSVGEAALLAGLPQAPSRYAPDKHLKAAKARQRYVLNRMVADGYLSPAKARYAYEQAMHLAGEKNEQTGENGYFIQLVRKEAEHILGSSLNRAGVRIFTSLDPYVQNKASLALRNGIDKNFTKKTDVQGAVVVLNGISGKVLALVGGKDFTKSAFDRATQGRRSAGSLFKPILYSAAFENGFRPTSVLFDAPLSIRGKKGRMWRPKNFSGKHYGATSLADGLIYSRNIVAIKLLEKVGIQTVQNMALQFGIRPPITTDLSLALGATGVSLLEITAAYTPFVGDGIYSTPRVIESIEKNDGTRIYRGTKESRRVISKHTATLLRGLLAEVITRGTGKRAKGAPAPCGGKTGTTNENRDAWFVGYSGSLLAGVWVGNDDNKSLGAQKSGGVVAAPIWRELMRSVRK